MSFRARLDNVTRSATGIRATANLSRTGLQTYYTDTGAPFIEYRPPDEVFHPDSLATFRGAPVTVGHPREVNADNIDELAVGHIGDDVRRNGQFVTATVYITDPSAADMVERGDIRELSMGYSVELDERPGEYEGERYDAVQTKIRTNHSALVFSGRAGPEVRVYADTNQSPLDRARREMVERHANAWRR